MEMGIYSKRLKTTKGETVVYDENNSLVPEATSGSLFLISIFTSALINFLSLS